MGNSVKIDEKGRLKIPANILTALKRAETQFYVTSECGDCLRIYPMEVWNQIEQKLGRLCLRNRHYQKFLARAKYFGRTVFMDNQDRILIPMPLRRAAQIKGTVVVLDYLGYLEVWNRARLLRTLKNDPLTAQEENVLNKQLASVSSLSSLMQNKRMHISGKSHRVSLYQRANRNSNPQKVRPIRGTRQSAPQRARVA